MDKVKVGVIGIGNIGLVHASSIFRGEIRGMVLAGLCDISQARRAVAAEHFPCIPCYADAQALMSGGVDAVIIAVPHPSHGDLAIQAFEKGLHVLVEKPVDITISKARLLNKAAAKSGKLFGIMFNQRTSPLFAKAREIVTSGALGTLRRSVWIITNWYRSQAYYDSGTWRATWQGEGGGVLINQSPHQLDLWQWICGMPESITAFCDVAKYHSIEVEDDATIFARFPGGATGVFITTTGEYPGTNRLEISGSKGKIVLENGTLKWWQLEQDEAEVCATSDKNAPRIPFAYQEFSQEKKPVLAGHAAILQNFADGILLGTPLIAPGYDGIFELTIQNAAYLSAWAGSTPVGIPFDEGAYDTMLEEKRKLSTHNRENTSRSADTVYNPRWQINW